jgi:hypothetical protein
MATTRIGSIEIDNTKQIPKLTLDFNMSPAVHYKWNIVEAARTLVEKPEDRKITLMVYKIHKDILRGKGISEEALERGDKRLTKRVERYVRWANENYLRSAEPQTDSIQ